MAAQVLTILMFLLLPYALAQPKHAIMHQIKLPLYSISIVNMLTPTMDVFINLIHIILINTVITDTTCYNTIKKLVFAMRF